MAETNAKKSQQRIFILSAEEWLNLKTEEAVVVFGSPDDPLVRPGTKNLIEAPEKCFKTTFTERLMLVSCPSDSCCKS